MAPDAADATSHLVASYSPAADRTFFPPRRRCPLTGGPVEPVRLARLGVLQSWTYVYEERFGDHRGGGGGYGVAAVDLPEGVRIQGRILGAFGDWEIGMPVEVLPRLPRQGESPRGVLFAPARGVRATPSP